MIKDNIPGAENVAVLTIDAAQGEQFDYVFIDFLFTGMPDSK